MNSVNGSLHVKVETETNAKLNFACHFCLVYSVFGNSGKAVHILSKQNRSRLLFFFVALVLVIHVGTPHAVVAGRSSSAPHIKFNTTKARGTSSA